MQMGDLRSWLSGVELEEHGCQDELEMHVQYESTDERRFKLSKPRPTSKQADRQTYSKKALS
jgi:hypothetical protein